VARGTVAEASLRERIEPLRHHEVLRVCTMRDAVALFLVQERLITSAAVVFATLAAVVSFGAGATSGEDVLIPP
jgi:hypothetical protein